MIYSPSVWHFSHFWPDVCCHDLAVLRTKKKKRNYINSGKVLDEQKRSPGFQQSRVAWNLHWAHPKFFLPGEPTAHLIQKEKKKLRDWRRGKNVRAQKKKMCRAENWLCVFVWYKNQVFDFKLQISHHASILPNAMLKQGAGYALRAALNIWKQQTLLPGGWLLTPLNV